MKLHEIKGTYDAIFSLGDLCLASIQLRQNNLRPFAGVLDWMGSPLLSNVNRLLKYRFYGFMDSSHLSILGYAGDKIVVSEDAYHIVSNHDFESGKNTLSHLATYPQVKDKFDRRIQRFLKKMDTCERILFVRTEGDMEDAEALQKILSGLVRNDFRVLIVNHADVRDLVEDDWPLKKVCAVRLPAVDKWTGNDHLWRKLFEGIELK
ncbi:DUF1796 family putative cysteine peptidase [Cohnella nanjingensis]|uniref:Peptidase n=1 Tax=Cohnella nanjingensis TaxID=1387779 RepID=A0A7X0VDM9_9BACL|nr:DUF1796 family putative cysteine peptidase [Cohnella nanjingensis]MBB6669398.1 peptidase [Cohnella nanjingensis]